MNFDCQVCQRDSTEGDDLSGNALARGSVDKTLVLIDNVNDSGKLAFVGTIVDQDDASYLHVALESHVDVFVVCGGQERTIGAPDDSENFESTVLYCRSFVRLERRKAGLVKR